MSNYQTIYYPKDRPWRLVENTSSDKLVDRFELCIGMYKDTEVIWSGNECLTFTECEREYKHFLKLQTILELS